MRFYKGTFDPSLGQLYEYYYAGLDFEFYYFYSLKQQRWRCSNELADDDDETWLSRKRHTDIREVSPLEVIVVVGSFPEEYKE